MGVLRRKEYDAGRGKERVCAAHLSPAGVVFYAFFDTTEKSLLRHISAEKGLK